MSEISSVSLHRITEKQGATVIPPELTYVEVIGVTASTGFDTDTEEDTSKNDKEKNSQPLLPLLVSPEQQKFLQSWKRTVTPPFPYFRGIKENAAKFTGLQDG